MLDMHTFAAPEGVIPDRPFQQDAGTVSSGPWDAVIAGAGPAGAMAACVLGRAGRKVLLMDKAQFPRDKVCGDLLAPDSLACLKTIGLNDAVRDLGFASRHFRVMSTSRASLDVTGDFVSLPRRTLDHLVAKKAVESGAVFIRASVKDAAGQGGPVCVFTKERPEPFSAKTVLLAVGAHVSLLGKRNMLTRKGCNAFAARCYVQSKADLDFFVASYDESVLPGYAWIFPLGRGVFNMGVGAFVKTRSGKPPGLKKKFARFVREHPLAREIMDKAQSQTPLKGAPLRCGLTGARPLAQGRILAAGECIGATYPFSGEGVGKAMETGALAAGLAVQALDENRLELLEDLPRLLEKSFRHRYNGYAQAQRWLSRAWLNDFIVRKANANPGLRRAASDVLNETADPREIFSLKGLWRAFRSR